MSYGAHCEVTRPLCTVGSEYRPAHDIGVTLKTSLETPVRVLDVVNWQTISKGQPDAGPYEDLVDSHRLGPPFLLGVLALTGIPTTSTTRLENSSQSGPCLPNT